MNIKMKKVLLVMGLGLGLSASVSVNAATDPELCDYLNTECSSGTNMLACFSWAKLCRVL